MRAFLTLDEADEQITKLAHHQIVIPITDLELSPTRIADATYVRVRCSTGHDFSPEAEREATAAIGINQKLLREYGEDIELCTALIRHSQVKRADLSARLTVVKDEVVGISVQEYTPPPLEDIWLTMLDCGDLTGIQEIRRQGSHIELRAIAGHTDHPPKQVDDISHAGVSVSLNGSLEVRPYVYRLVCRNGMLACHDLPTLDTAASTDMALADFHTTFAASLRVAHATLARFVATAADHVEQPANLLVRWMDDLGIPNRDRLAMTKMLPSLPVRASVYDVINLITGYAKQFEDLGKRNRFEQLGGSALEHMVNPTHQCSHCRQSL